MINKKGQIGLEYLMIVGLVTFVISSIILVAFFYSNNARDTLRMSQTEGFAKKIVASAESVFYSGEPSKATINTYLPEGVKAIEIMEDSIIITIITNTGENKRAFYSNVPIEGTLSYNSGIRKIKIEAKEDRVEISNA